MGIGVSVYPISFELIGDFKRKVAIKKNARLETYFWTNLFPLIAKVYRLYRGMTIFQIQH